MSLAQQHLDIQKTIAGRKLFALCVDAKIRRAIMDSARKRGNITVPVSIMAGGVLIGSVE